MMIQRRSASNVFNVWEIFAKWNFTSIFQMILTPIRWPLWFERIFQPQNPISDRILLLPELSREKKINNALNSPQPANQPQVFTQNKLKKRSRSLKCIHCCGIWWKFTRSNEREREKARDVFSQSFEECAIMTWWWAEKLNWISFLWPNWILSRSQMIHELGCNVNNG